MSLTQHQITGARQQETNKEQEPGAHPLVGETPEGEGPLASPLVGGGGGKVPCCARPVLLVCAVGRHCPSMQK